MKKYTLYQVNAFTKNPSAGNTAGVVTNADGLSPDEMQKIATEANYTTSAFVFNPNAEDHDTWLRFFTPTTELPMCGHATLAANYVYAINTQTDTASIVQKTQKGMIPVEIEKNGGDYKIFMTQGKPDYLGEVKGEIKDELLSALMISPEAMDE